MGLIEMKFNSGHKNFEIMMDGIDEAIQYKILKLCMSGVKEDETKEEVKDEPKEELPEVITHTNQPSEEAIKAGYNLFNQPVLESKDEPKINEKAAAESTTYSMDKSIRLKNGVKHYQLFYICPDCGNKGKHHIKPGTPSINCHEHTCSKKMMVRLATPKGLPHMDGWGNYYIAGEFKMSLKDKEDEEEFNSSDSEFSYYEDLDEKDKKKVKASFA